MKNIYIIFVKLAFIVCICNACMACFAQEKITPYKYEDELPRYDIPKSSRFTVSRGVIGTPDVVYYLSRPQKETFPIAILCEGSSDNSNIASVIHFHRYFLQECMDLGLATLTVEQWGVDGNNIDKDMWVKHYTRSQRLEDHRSAYFKAASITF